MNHQSLSNLEVKMLFLLRVGIEAKGDDRIAWRRAVVELLAELNPVA